MSKVVIIRGAGDLASAVALRLKKSGFHILMCETSAPTSIRRTVCFSECIWEGEKEIEGVKAVRINDVSEISNVFADDKIAVIADPELDCLSKVDCIALVDAIIAKRNLGTKKSMAPLTIALGPGFTAGKDVHAVIETMRGHYLGMIYYSGKAMKNTGVPGAIMGFAAERVIHSPAAGVFKSDLNIGDSVRKGDVIANVGDCPVYASISGVLRGLLRSGLEVTEGFKCADIDPREDAAGYITTVSDKARAISGSVLECILNCIWKERKSASMHHAKSSSLQNNADFSAMQSSSAENDCVDIYVDGSCNADASAIGYGVVIIRDNRVYEFSGEVDDAESCVFRNIAGEIEASMFAMKYCIENEIGNVRLFFDYSGLQDWCTGAWRCKNALTQKYKAFYDSIKDRLNVIWNKVDAHTGNRYNELADKLAKKCFLKHVGESEQV